MVFGIQITLANKHPIRRSAYELFYEKLGLDHKTDRVTIYIISTERNTEGYAKVSMSYF